jgi:hypothetical protein
MKDLAKDTADDDTSVELITSDPVKGVPFNDEAFAREELLGAVRLESAAGSSLVFGHEPDAGQRRERELGRERLPARAERLGVDAAEVAHVAAAV